MDQQKSLGNCRVILPPRDYILGVAGRANGRLRAEPQPFTIRSNQAVRVAMDIDTGFAKERVFYRINPGAFSENEFDDSTYKVALLPRAPYYLRKHVLRPNRT